ncbi:tetratricopeptide repeat protein [Adonisia turfae]
MAETKDSSWARQQYDLGVECHNRRTGERAENLEQALIAFENALAVFTHNRFSRDWANTQEWLGTIYSARIQGKRSENLEQAIDYYQNALQIYTRTTFPEYWARTQMNLGVTYQNRIRGEHSENLEQAIDCYKNALQILTRNEFPEYWARTQMNLGVAYQNRTQGERSENLEQAIDCYQNTLQVHTRSAFPEYWARTQQNLANVYRDSHHGEDLEILNLALGTYQKVAEVFTRKSYPYDWVNNQSDWAEALLKLASFTTNPTQVVTNLTTSITLLTEALEVAPSSSPEYIDSLYRLGNALFRRYAISQNSNDLDRALKAYKNALDAIDPEHYDRNKIWQALPTTQSVLGSRLVRDGQWQDGLQLLLNSVSQLRNSDNRLAHASALYETAYAYETMSDWDNARLYYRDALRLYDHLEEQSGKAKSLTGLGTTLGAQGYLEKSMATFQQARDLYEQLQQPEKVTEVDNLYDIAKRTLNNEDIEAQDMEIPA